MAKRSTPELSTSSMADIAFLLLTFFLLTTTMDQNLGMPRRLPPILEDEQEKPPEINRRNILQVHVNSFDRLLVNGKPMEVILLKDEVKLFISNPNNDGDKPEKEPKIIEGLGERIVSKGIVSLQTDRGTSYQIYMAVQNEIMRAYAELRDDFAQSQFQKPYSKLQEAEQEAVRGFYPLNISEAEPRETKKKK
jgi:biopolymer transport protein ExbD